MRLRGNVPRERKCYHIPADLRTKSTFVANDSRLDELSGLELGPDAGVGVVTRGREDDRPLYGRLFVRRRDARERGALVRMGAALADGRSPAQVVVPGGGTYHGML